jgi:RNA-directed DNA polymerase
MVVDFQFEADARRFVAYLSHRLERFGLQLNADKTRTIEFGRYAAKNRMPAGLYRKPSTSLSLRRWPPSMIASIRRH